MTMVATQDKENEKNEILCLTENKEVFSETFFNLAWHRKWFFAQFGRKDLKEPLEQDLEKIVWIVKVVQIYVWGGSGRL